MKKNTVKKIFISFMVFLPLQYAAVGIVGVLASEPWPAFVLPAFQNVDSTPEYVSVIKPDFTVIDHKGNRHTNVEPAKLFNGIEETQLQGFLRTHMGDSTRWAQKGELSRKWLLKKAQNEYPSLTFKSMHMKWQQIYYNFSSSKIQIDSIKVIEEFTVFGDERS